MRTTVSLAADSPRASLAVERAHAEPQTVDIWIDRGYQPAQTVASADVPLRIVFHRRDADLCTQRVVFSSPHIERRLAANGTTTVELPGQPAGIVRFTCGMGRYRGEIELVGHRPRLATRGRLLGPMVAAGAAVLTLLAATGIVEVELAAGAGVLIVATGIALSASRLRTHPYHQR